MDGEVIEHTAAAALATDGFRIQLVSAVDGFGAPILFASLCVYILMLLVVKPFLEGWAADKGKSESQRSRLTFSATLLPGLIAASLVDFSPIARALGVSLHWAAAIPVGAIFYAGGGVLVHNVVKRFDPLGKIEEKIFGKARHEIDAELEERFTAATTTGIEAVTPEQVEADRKEKGIE